MAMPAMEAQHKYLEPWQYTVVWFCATEEEGRVARACMDERYDEPSLTSESDTYYNYGGIVGKHGTHAIVIVRGTRSGKVGMLDAASQVLGNFPNIKHCFFVGIAGSLPHGNSSTDLANVLRKGDVVIAQAKGGDPAVLEYDHADFHGLRNFRPKWHSDNTIKHLQSLSNQWYDAYEDGDSKAQDILVELIRKRPDFAAPRPKYDLLFQPSDTHRGEEGDCSRCIQLYSSIRTRTDAREDSCYKMKVYRGLVVTGDVVARHHVLREAIKSQSWGCRALCVDMESAVLMDGFHPLIIRGISDYADTHYGWKWTSYAAACAAAVAKDMIRRLQMRRLPQESSVGTQPSTVGTNAGTTNRDRQEGTAIVDGPVHAQLFAPRSKFDNTVFHYQRSG